MDIKKFNKLKGGVILELLQSSKKNIPGGFDSFQVALQHRERHLRIDIVQLAKIHQKEAVRIGDIRYRLSTSRKSLDGLRLVLNLRVDRALFHKHPVKQRYLRGSSETLLNILFKEEGPDDFNTLLWSLVIAMQSSRKFVNGFMLTRRKIEVLPPSTDQQPLIDWVWIEHVTWWEPNPIIGRIEDYNPPLLCQMLNALGAKPYI